MMALVNRLLLFKSRSGESQADSPREVGTRRNHMLVPYTSTLRARKLNMRQAFPKIQAAARDQHSSANHLQCRRVMEEIGVNHLLARVPMVRRTKRATG